MAKNFEITCPCCEATVVIDRISGEVLLHKAKEHKVTGSLESMVSGLERQRTEAEKKFDKQIEAQKDRARILEEKFKEAMKRAGDNDEKYVNPLDMD